ncbi:LysR family transcriptional regulator [Propionispira raffinosivorans]|uniref:LysR family transcriptional regulator n=1 Tax=Propionispira raffinosivorans TaxID=86959 RepID=UPI000362047D|nr:LysR family transcriptional regulator [Propionispira raffinosivorans]
MIDEREMKYILQVAEELSFSQAAKKLYVSQPSLSQCIKKVEIEIGVELFDRRTSPLTLTFAGGLYIKKAKQIQTIQQDLLSQIEDLSDLKRGHLKIGTSYSRTAYLLTRILPEFRMRFPGIDISLVEGTTIELQEYAASGMTDLSFVYLPLKNEELIYEHIVDEEILLALPANHPISQKFSSQEQTIPFPKVSFAAFANEPFIVMKNKRKMREAFLTLCEKTKTHPKVILQSNSLVSAQSLVAVGVGATLVTDTLALYNKLASNPCYFSLIEPIEPRHMVAAYPKKVRLSKAADAFLQLTKEYM